MFVFCVVQKVPRHFLRENHQILFSMLQYALINEDLPHPVFVCKSFLFYQICFPFFAIIVCVICSVFNCQGFSFLAGLFHSGVSMYKRVPPTPCAFFKVSFSGLSNIYFYLLSSSYIMFLCTPRWCNFCFFIYAFFINIVIL